MVDDVTLDTLIRDLEAPIRLKNALHNGGRAFDWPTPTRVRDYIDVPDHELMRISNFGRKSLREWHRITAHLRPGYTETIAEKDEEYAALKKARSTLNQIGGLHKQLARLYADLADIVLPVTMK